MVLKNKFIIKLENMIENMAKFEEKEIEIDSPLKRKML